MGSTARLHHHIPQRFARPRRAADGPNRIRCRIDFREPVDAMPFRELTRGDRIPKHGRQDRSESVDIAHHAAIDQPLEVRHFAGVEQGRHHFPISRVPADQ